LFSNAKLFKKNNKCSITWRYWKFCFKKNIENDIHVTYKHININVIVPKYCMKVFMLLMFNCMCNKIQLEGAINSPDWQKEMRPLAMKDSWLSDSLAFIPNWIMHKSKIFSMVYKCEQSLLFMTSLWYLHTPYTNSNEFRWLSFYTICVLLLLAMFVGTPATRKTPSSVRRISGTMTWCWAAIIRETLIVLLPQPVSCLFTCWIQKSHPNIAMLLWITVTSHCPSL
jgi:hypothetical protein